MNAMIYAGLPFEIQREVKNPSIKMLRAEEIKNLVESHFDVTTEDLMRTTIGGREEERKLIPRQVWQFLLKKHTDLTLKEIGRLTNRHHATVINALKKIDHIKDFKYDPYFKTTNEIIEKAQKL